MLVSFVAVVTSCQRVARSTGAVRIIKPHAGMQPVCKKIADQASEISAKMLDIWEGAKIGLHEFPILVHLGRSRFLVYDDHITALS